MKSDDQDNTETRNCELASKLLSDAAKFFRNVAEQNPDIKDVMLNNADVYDQVALVVLKDPLGKSLTD